MTRLGDRLPANFIAAHKRQRIIRAFAEIVVEKGFPGSVTEIVSWTGVARNTFYEAFGSKDDVGLALIAKVFPDLADDLDPSDVGQSGLGALAVEVAARAETSDAAAINHAVESLGTLRAVAESVGAPAEVDDSLQCSLPPGRHGLPRDFVRANQSHRLLTALAEVVVERGFRLVTIADVTKRAKVSRRTFYEHFTGIEDAGHSVCSHASNQAASALESAGLKSGLGILVVEAVAIGLAESQAASVAFTDSVDSALRLINAPLQPAEIAA